MDAKRKVFVCEGFDVDVIPHVLVLASRRPMMKRDIQIDVDLLDGTTVRTNVVLQPYRVPYVSTKVPMSNRTVCRSRFRR